MAVSGPLDAVFDAFDVFEETFKTIDSHDIKAAFLIPKGLERGTHPVILNLHGGFFITGHSLFAMSFPRWVIEMALKKSAIIVSADYRLLPSANGIADQLEDVNDFWEWSRTKMPSVLDNVAPGQAVDLSKLMLTGASAGGYFATQLALSNPDEISLLAITYPLLALKDPLYVTGPRAGEPNVMRYADDDILPKTEVETWIEETRKTIASKAGLERAAFAVGACHAGIFYSQITDNKKFDSLEFFPLGRMEAGARLPAKVWMMHGDEDATVHIRQAHRFAAIIADQVPSTELRFDVVAGQDHGFDVEDKNWTSFKKDALKFVEAAWLE